MIELFNISLVHEYQQGACEHLALTPFSDLKQLQFKNRLRYKNEIGGIKCFCEQDKSPVSEVDYFRFWLIYTSSEFINYSDFDRQLLFNSPKFVWKDWDKDLGVEKKVFKTVLLDDDSIQQFKLKQEGIPRNALGLVAIKSELLSENLSIEVHFKTANTYWQYRIKTDTELSDWKFKIEDKREELEFESAINNGELWFTSKTALPYFKHSNDRLLLKWEPNKDTYDFHKYKKQLPFPDFKYKEVTANKVISPIYIKL